MGVSALCWATVYELLRRLPNAKLTAMDFGRGLRRETFPVEDRQCTISRCGARHSRRLYRSDTLWNIRVAARFGGFVECGGPTTPGADAILDISGGDSFTDLYGEHRFQAVAYTKQIALEHQIPLILLPQTYGPFQSDRLRDEASRIVRASTLAIARDARSFETLRELAGSEI
jgi:polysaccharide pyruvyl transferase WcaK-like protein